MNRTKAAIKTGAAALALQVFFTNCLFANTAERSFYEERSQRTAKASLLASLPASLPLIQATAPTVSTPVHLPALAGIPTLDASLGNVRSIEMNPSSNQSIVYIQDVHGNDEAQRHIASAVSALIDQGNADVIVLEGAAGEINLKGFRDCRWPESARRTADGLLADHKISGAVYGAVLAKRTVPVVGAEQLSLYNRNVDAVRQAQARIPAVHAALAARKSALDEAKARTYSPALLALDRTVDGHRAGTVPLGRYAEAVVAGQKNISADMAAFLEAVRIEEKMDSKAAERERSTLLSRLAPKLSEADTRGLIESGVDYRAGKIRAADFYKRLSEICRRSGVPLTDFPAMNQYVRYVLLADSINMDRVSADLDGFERARFEKLAATDAERSIVADAAALNLQTNLCDFALTSDEWARYRPMSGRDPMLAPFEAFYASAELRNAAITRNLISAMRVHGSKAILVTGGFHSKEVARAIGQRATISNFVPRLSSVNADSTSAALSVFSREKTPLDRLFAGERLFLAPNPASPVALREAVPLRAADALHHNLATQEQAVAAASDGSGMTVTSMKDGDSSVSIEAVNANTEAELNVPFDRIGRPRSPLLKNFAGRFRSFAMNSTFVLAPAFTYLTFIFFASIGFPIDMYWSPAIWLLYKAGVLIAVSFHERGHLIAAGRFPWGDPDTQMRLIVDSLLHDPAIKSMDDKALYRRMAIPVLLGYDTTNAYVTAPQTTPNEVRAIAKAGPMANVRIAAYGLGGFLFSAAIFFAGVPLLFAMPVAVVAFSLMLTNVALLTINVLGTDYRAIVSGVRPNVYRAGPASSPSNPAEHLLGEEEVDLPQTSDKPRLNRVVVQRYLDNVLKELGDSRTEDFDGIMYPAVLAIVGASLKSAAAKFHMRSTIEAGEYKLKVTFEKGGVPVDEISAIEAEWMSPGWKMALENAAGTGLQTITITGPINPALSIENLPVTPAEMTALMGTLKDDGRRQVKHLVRAALSPAADAPAFYVGTDRLLAALYMGDAEILSLAIKRLLASSDANVKSKLATELNQLSSIPEMNLLVRRQAAWMLATVPGLVKEADVGAGWRYAQLSNLRLSNLRTVRFSLSAPGVVDLVIEEPAGILGLILQVFHLRLKRTVAIIRLEYPRVQSTGTDSLDEESLRFVRLSFPTDKRPSMEVFDAVMTFWGAEIAPMQTILEMPFDARQSAPIRDAGFRRTVHHDLDDNTVTLQKTSEARKSPSGRAPLESGTNYIGTALKMVFGAPINIIAFMDEMFHWVGSLVEGATDNTEWTTRIGVLLGLEIAESDFIPQSEDYYRRHPWKRDFTAIAAPIGWVLTAAVLGTVLGLYMAGIIHPPTWIVWTMYYFLAGAVIQLLITFLLTTSIGRALIGPEFKGTDFWRWYESITKKREKITTPKKPGTAPTLEELLERARSKNHSPTLDLADSIRGLFRAIANAWRARALASKGLGDLTDAIRREVTATGQLSSRTIESIRFRSAHLLKRFINNAKMDDVREYHEITYAVLVSAMKDRLNPLTGAVPRLVDGSSIPDGILETFFTPEGWIAFKAHRSGETESDFPGLIQRPALGRSQLMLSALDPNPGKVKDFFTLVGKPDAAAEALRLLEQGKGEAIALLDTAAIPWEPFEKGEQFGSINGDFESLSGADRRNYLRRLFSADAALLVAATLLNRTDSMKDKERATLLDLVRAAVDGTATALLPENLSAEREDMGKTVRELTALRQAEKTNWHSGTFDLMRAARGAFSGDGSRSEQPQTMPFEKAPGKPDSEAPILGGGDNPGGPGGRFGTRTRISLVVNGAAQTQYVDILTTTQDPLERLLLDLNVKERPATAPQNATPGQAPVTDLTKPIPGRLPVSPLMAIANGAGQTNPFSPLTPNAVTPADQRNRAAGQPVVTNAANQNPGGNESVEISGRDQTTSANSALRSGQALARNSRASSDNEGTAASARQNDARTNRTGQLTTDEAIRQADTRAAEAANTANTTDRRSRALTERAGVTNGISPRGGKGLETQTPRREAGIFQAGSPFAAINEFLNNRGFDIGALIAALTAVTALLALAIQALGIPNIWLPATLFTVLASGISVMIFSLRGNQALVPSGFAPGFATENGTFPGIPANTFTVFSPNRSANQRTYSTTGLQSITTGLFSIARFVFRSTGSNAAQMDRAIQTAAERQLVALASAIATLDSAAALIAEYRNVSTDQAVAILADDKQLTAEERAVVEELAKATRQSARAAIAKTQAASSADERSALANTDFDRTASNVRPDLTDLRKVALIYIEISQQSLKSAPRDERAQQITDTATEGRVLLSLKRAFIEQFLNPVPRKAGAVRVLKISSGRTSGARLVVPQTPGKPRVTGSGSIDNTDLDGLHVTSGRAQNGLSLGFRLGFPSDTKLTNASGRSLLASENRQVISALGIFAAKSSEDLVRANTEGENVGGKTEGTTVGATLGGNARGAKGRTSSNSVALGQTPDPATVLIEKILSSVRKPASIAATTTVVLLAGAAVAFGVVEAVVAVLTVAVMFLVALGAQIAKLQSGAGEPAEKTNAARVNAAGVETTERPSLTEDDLNRLADLISNFIAGRARLGTTEDGAAFATLLPTVESLGVGNERIAIAATGLSDTDLERLATRVAKNLSGLNLERRPSTDEALTWLKALMAAGGRAMPLKALAGDKDMYYPVRERTNPGDMKAEMDGVENIRLSLSSQRVLYLSYESGKEAVKDAIRIRFARDIAAGRIQLIPRSGEMFEERNGRTLIRLSTLAADLTAALGANKVGNLLVLIPNHVGWDDTGLGRNSVLDQIGFVLLQDFTTGMQLDRAALRNIGHLAEMISTQA